ncbi:OprD family outer membrane porin [Acinetobacter sp. WZC-1]|uniref:OprD family outer membrane porin n=1 Tax=Acinetobacter sp. WZC-1 TaxID=3459034 RepID=UPI00403DB130
MLKAQKLTSAVLIHIAFISSAAQASEQSEAKGFMEDSKASILFRNGWIYRDRSDGRHDLSSWAQGTIGNYDSGFTKGIVGFGVGAVGDFTFKLGENKNSGNQMIPHHNDGTPYSQWSRGGANVKARISNTTVRYGTQKVELPVLSSNSARLLPEYFTGTLITSREIKDLELTFGHFTKDQYSDHIATDQGELKRAIVYGAKYKVNDRLNTSYYGADLKDALSRHYLNVNYKYPLASEDSLTLNFSGYHTKYESDIYNRLSFPTGEENTDKKNNIWAVSGTYNTGPHTVMVAYQQSNGNVGYDYSVAADGGDSIYLPNSYLSDFNGNGEKSIQAQYSLDFTKFGAPGLNWTTAYVHGWDINVGDVTDNAREDEFFNQVKYTVQSGVAKNLSFRVRNSIYRASDEYSRTYLGDTNEWRIFVDYPLDLF